MGPQISGRAKKLTRFSSYKFWVTVRSLNVGGYLTLGHSLLVNHWARQRFDIGIDREEDRLTFYYYHLSKLKGHPNLRQTDILTYVKRTSCNSQNWHICFPCIYNELITRFRFASTSYQDKAAVSRYEILIHAMKWLSVIRNSI